MTMTRRLGDWATMWGRTPPMWGRTPRWTRALVIVLAGFAMAPAGATAATGDLTQPAGTLGCVEYRATSAMEGCLEAAPGFGLDTANVRVISDAQAPVERSWPPRRLVMFAGGLGAVLLVLAIPCVLWRGWYFWVLFLALAVSGIWRLCFPQKSIRVQRTIYPRRVHGLLLIGGAFLIWALRPRPCR